MPKLIKGEGSINEIGHEIEKAGYDAVFLICSRHFKRGNDFSFLHGKTVTIFVKTGTNVEMTEAKKAFEDFSKNKRQAIVAIGGGSVIDIAKYIIYRLAETSSPIPFFVVAPTTAGSGSEATHFAVIYQEKKKTSLAHHSLLPELVILDPQLTYSLPAYQRAISGMDVLAQAIESYWNVNATAESKDYASKSILKWKDFFIKSMTAPDTITNEGMQEAAYMAGKAINITRTTGPHALSYYLTANHHIPHGQAVAIFLPVFFYYNNPPGELLQLLEVKNNAEAAAMIREKMKEAGLATTLEELGIEKENIMEELLNEVNEERFSNNPAKFDREKLQQLITEYL